MEGSRDFHWSPLFFPRTRLSLKYFSGSLFPALSQRISYAEPGCWQPFLHRGSRSSLRVCGAQSHPIGGSLLKARKKQHVLAGAPTIIIHQQLLGWLNVRTLPFDARGADLWDGFRRPGAGEICCSAIGSGMAWSTLRPQTVMNWSTWAFFKKNSGVQQVQKEFGNGTLLYATCC